MSLTYFEDAEMQPMPKMFDKTSWAEMQKAIIEKVNNAYVVTAYRNKNEYDFFGKQSKVFKTLIDARKAVENGFKKWENYHGE